MVALIDEDNLNGRVGQSFRSTEAAKSPSDDYDHRQACIFVRRGNSSHGFVITCEEDSLDTGGPESEQKSAAKFEHGNNNRTP
jgi:hypothetical protein